ncbi:MAG: hypothetical protein K2I20_01020, partial [Clostridia bacterium]|nr:hypothetical protein [Clostridia bacterium]
MEEMQTVSTPTTNKQYLKYSDSFKKQCVLNIAAGICILLGTILLLFVPIFKIDAFIISVEFSFFDEIKLAFSELLGSGSLAAVAASDSGTAGGYSSVFWIYGIFQIMAIIMFAIGICCLLADVVKSCFGIVNPDTYAITQYDKIKTRATEGKGRRFGRYYSPASFMVSGVMCEIFYVVYVKIFSNIPGGGSAYMYSNFLSVTGVSWTIIFPFLFIAAYVVCWALKKYMFGQVKTAILKEDYQI